jgi:hypothetical protein
MLKIPHMTAAVIAIAGVPSTAWVNPANKSLNIFESFHAARRE